jgi:anthranilate phosphoribosyltransferase
MSVKLLTGMLQELIGYLNTGQALSAQQVHLAVAQLTDETVSAELKADFLAALARKGETPEEITAFAVELRDRAVPVHWAPDTPGQELVDVVGTGGDQLGTFNLSTAAALVVAAAGLPVAKHGNRAVTSQTGSADVVEALGIPIELSPEQAAAMLRTHGFAFLFAPRFHPAFRQIAPARKLCAQRGQRTIFNLLGPLLNPARPTAMLMGVAQPALCLPMACALQRLGVRRAMVVCGHLPGSQPGRQQFLDEVSTLGPTTIASYQPGQAPTAWTFDPAGLPLQAASLTDLQGGDRLTNARILRQVLLGEDRGPRRDAVLLNAGAALCAAGRCQTIAEGWQVAAELIDAGQARRKLDELAAAAP